MRGALVYLSALNEQTFNQVSEVHVNSSGQLTGYTIHAIRIKLGGIERMAEKAAQTSAVLSDQAKNLSTIEYIDVSYVTPYVKFRQHREGS